MFTTAVVVLMPVIATIAGVRIYMYLRDHQPPHFHARYNGDEEVFDLDGESRRGALPPKKSGKVSRWARRNKPFLRDKWDELQQ